MKKLSTKEWVGVFAAIVFVAYMLFGDTIMNAFRQSAPTLSGQDNTGNMANVNGFNSNVEKRDITVGTGERIQPGMIVSVNYVLSLEDGTLIQDSKTVGGGQPFQFIYGAGQLIPGWEMGIEGMKVGGKRIITIPPELGYGSQAVGPIPANSTLVFEIEVTNAEAAPSAPVQ